MSIPASGKAKARVGLEEGIYFMLDPPVDIPVALDAEVEGNTIVEGGISRVDLRCLFLRMPPPHQTSGMSIWNYLTADDLGSVSSTGLCFQLFCWCFLPCHPQHERLLLLPSVIALTESNPIIHDAVLNLASVGHIFLRIIGFYNPTVSVTPLGTVTYACDVRHSFCFTHI